MECERQIQVLAIFSNDDKVELSYIIVAATVAMLTKHKCLQCDQTPCSLTASVHRTHQEAWGIANDALNSDTSVDKYQTSYAWTSGARVPWSVVEVTLSSKLPFLLHLGPDFDDPTPSGPFWKPFGSFFSDKSCFEENLLYFTFCFFCFCFCVTPLLLLDCLHNCTEVNEAPDQNSGEIEEAPTWNSAGPPPEARGTVAGRPKVSSQWKTLKRDH